MIRPPEPITTGIDRRRPIWVVISDLFLDTELDEDQLREIARVLKSSGYTPEELDWIYWREVGPAVGGNALSMVGIWNGFDEESLVNAILARQRSWRRRFPSVTGYLGCRAVRNKWDRVKTLFKQQREP